MLRYIVNYKYSNLRRILIVIIDIFLANFALIASLYLSKDINLENYFLIRYLFPISIFLFFLYLFTGVYKGLSQYVGSSFIYSLGIKNLALTIFTDFVLRANGFNLFRLDFYLLFWFLTTVFISSFRLLLRDSLILLKKIDRTDLDKEKVAIYGAGDAGGQLSIALNREKKIHHKMFHR